MNETFRTWQRRRRPLRDQLNALLELSGAVPCWNGTREVTRLSGPARSWITYGLGSENQNFPGYVTICQTRSRE